MNLKKILQTGIATTAMLCLVSFGAVAQNGNSNDNSSNGKLSTADRQFVTKAAQGGMAEVELGQLATQKAQSAQVKQFGQRMVDDHTKANDQLKQVASQENITLPTGLDAKDQALKDRLEKLSGAQFDKVYMQHMVMDHKKDIAEFQKEANSGKDQQVKQFAQQTLPTLQQHLQMAQQDEQAVMKKGNNGSTTASNQQQ
jgi:putative membrane protein